MCSANSNGLDAYTVTKARIQTACLAVIIWTPLSITPLARGYEPRPGEPHPDFVLPRIEDGAAVQLSQYRGQRVLLVHFASW